MIFTSYSKSSVTIYPTQSKQPSFQSDERGTCLAFRVTPWPLRINAEGHVLKQEVTSLSVRPLLFYPCLTILLSPSLMLSQVAAIASSVYASYCMTYTWRSCSLFIYRTPTAWACLSAVWITSAAVSSLTFSFSRRHRRSRCIPSNLGASGAPWKWKGQIKQALRLDISHSL